VLKTGVLAAGFAVGAAYVVWRRTSRGAGGPVLAPGIVIDPSKARAILDLGKEVVGASVEQALTSRVRAAA
jgi:hypothetical protein